MQKIGVLLLLMILFSSIVFGVNTITLSKDLENVEVIYSLLGIKYRLHVSSPGDRIEIRVPPNIEILYQNAEPISVTNLETSFLWIFIINRGTHITYENIDNLEIIFRYPNSEDQVNAKAYSIFS